MTNYRFVFYVTSKARTRIWHELMRAGAAAHGDHVDYVGVEDYEKPVPGSDGGIMIGMSRATKRIMEVNRAAGKHFIYLDKGYIGRNFYWRFSIDAWQPIAYFQRRPRDDGRSRKAGLRVEPRRVSRDMDAIVLAGACQNYSNFLGLGNVNDYNTEVVSQLRANSARRVVYRPNPSWYRKHHDEFRPIPDAELSLPETPFARVLDSCHLLVTHGTSAAFEAFAGGVPVMVLGGGICKPVALGPEYSKVEEGYWPDDSARAQFFADVGYCQWTPAEYRSGAAWAEVRDVLGYLQAGS